MIMEKDELNKCYVLNSNYNLEYCLFNYNLFHNNYDLEYCLFNF